MIAERLLEGSCFPGAARRRDIARGSAGEVRSMLVFFERRPALVDFRCQISELKETLERELTYRTQHLESLREYLTVERERIINRLIPARHALAGLVQVMPVALEIRLPPRLLLR